MNRKLTLYAVLAAPLALSGGCGPDPEPLEPARVTPIRVENPKFAAEAGIEARVNSEQSASLQAIGKTRSFGFRPDAFAMLSAERSFDQAQRAERLLGDVGGFSPLYAELAEPESELPPVVEPIPAWRLSGVIIREGVSAILDMGNTTVIISPGQRIPDTEWTVVSIDIERALLRRSGPTLPREISIPLQGTFPGQGGGGAAPGGGPGTPRGGGGGVEGAPPPGRDEGRG